MRLIAHMLGLPENDGDSSQVDHEILEDGITDDSAMMPAAEMTDYFIGHIEERKQKPERRPDHHLLNARDRRPAARRPRAGLAAPAADRRHRHDLERHRLVHLASGQDARRPPAAGRRACADADRDRGVPARLRASDDGARGGEGDRDQRLHVQAGQMVLLSFPAANRDPAMFADADKVIIDRKENRHAAFGLGIHRCVGSNLARMEMTVAVEEWLKRIPEFRLEAGEVTWSEGTVRGPRQLPLLFGKRTEASLISTSAAIARRRQSPASMHFGVNIMADEPLLTFADSKLTRTKQRWAREGKFLTGKMGQSKEQRLPPGQNQK